MTKKLAASLTSISEALASHPGPQMTPDAAPVTVQVAAPVYWVNVDATFTPRRGFETVLFRSIIETPRTESEIIAELLSSGDYHRVAPRAAELRPVKPTRFLLKTWTAAGVLRRSN
jgi:hypothetical protein